MDLIDRQAAIDALHTWFRDGFDEDKWWNSTHVLAAIEGLPSAQPEIIRCKDCKHFELNHFDNVNGIPLITTHEICMRWGDGCKTDSNGFCFMGEKDE